MTSGRRCWLTLILAVVLAVAIGPAAGAAQARKPQIMAGKKTLYERVLTRPGALVVASPGAADGKPVPAFSQYYVYGRKTDGGQEWLEIGSGAQGEVNGWTKAASALPWKQQMALVFTNPAGRERALLLRGRDDVMALLQAPDPAAAVAPLRQSLAAGKPDPKILSTEPDVHIDIAKQFYLLPILAAKEVETGKGFRVRVLEVASVTAREEPKSEEGAAAPPAASDAIRGFSAAIVFVIDSTMSMGPYIDRTRAAVEQIYRAIETAGLTRKVRFGLVAFRSSNEAVAGLEYLTKVYANPNDVSGSKDFMAKVAAVQPAKVSSARFDEDAYAGVMAAARSIDWKTFGSRHIVLITDAGAIDGGDKLSSTGFDAQQVRLELGKEGIALWAMHLKTPQGKRNHARAERQFEDLSRWSDDADPLYFGIPSGSVEAFGGRVDALARALVKQVDGAERGQMVAGSARAAKREEPEPPPADKDDARLAEAAALVGQAMQLAYLGRVSGAEAPDVFKAWLSDRDYVSPEKATTEVRVLLTKNQLSDLAQAVTAILDAGEQSQVTSSADFFDLIRSAAAHLARDPEALKDPAASRLGDLGLLGEYLDDLPYKSDVASLNRDDWVAWSTSQQEELLDKLRRKLRHYQLFEEDVDRWVALAPDAPPGERVYPVPLEALP